MNLICMYLFSSYFSLHSGLPDSDQSIVSIFLYNELLNCLFDCCTAVIVSCIQNKIYNTFLDILLLKILNIAALKQGNEFIKYGDVLVNY